MLLCGGVLHLLRNFPVVHGARQCCCVVGGVLCIEVTQGDQLRTGIFSVSGLALRIFGLGVGNIFYHVTAPLEIDCIIWPLIAQSLSLDRKIFDFPSRIFRSIKFFSLSFC